VLWCLAVACSGAGAKGTNGPKADRAAQPDRDWANVLELAGSAQPGSRQRLEAFAGRGDQAASTQLAARILPLWNDRAGTYYSDAPRPLSQTCLSEEERRQLPIDAATFGIVAVRVTVAPNGVAKEAQIVSGPPNPALRTAIQRAVTKMLFVPARQKTGYVAAVVTITCRQEPGR
jgi:TonB family protein